MLEVIKKESKIQKLKLKTRSIPNPGPHDHSAELKRVSRIKGQIEGVARMINDRRYCPEIVQQIKAIRSALRGLEASIVEGHMEHCVQQALDSKDPKRIQEKFAEIMNLIKGQS